MQLYGDPSLCDAEIVIEKNKGACILCTLLLMCFCFFIVSTI